MAPWRVVSRNRGSTGALCVLPLDLPGMTTSSCLPLEPSMMVMILLPGGGAAAGMATFTDGALSDGGPSWRDCCWPSPAGFACGLAAEPVATTAVGSPPRGSLTKIAQAATRIANDPSAPARICGAAAGSFGRPFRLSWPRGAFRSSGATAQILANHLVSLPRDDSTGARRKQTGRPLGRPAGTRLTDMAAISSAPGPWNSAGTPN